jgi:hypothetical protein
MLPAFLGLVFDDTGVDILELNRDNTCSDSSVVTTLASVDYRLDVHDKEGRTTLHYDGDSEVPEALVTDDCVLDVEDKKEETSIHCGLCVWSWL